MKDRQIALDLAAGHAARWLGSLATRPVPPRASVADVTEALGTELPDGPTPAPEVIDLLADACDLGLTAMPSGRFYGMVIGGTHPAALAADWLVSAWDQNAALRQVTPAHAAVEDIASAWLLDLLGLPPQSGVGFVTGATMSNFTCLAAARDQVLRSAGWDVARDGLSGAPRVRVFVGEERHDTVDLALRYLGLGQPALVPADDQGRIDPAALAAALAGMPAGTPAIVVLQAGNVHSGAFDPFAAAIEAAHRHGAWVHVDGAFGLFAAASPLTSHLVAACERAESWTTDAHKTLNVPYDCGIAIVADPEALRRAMQSPAAYLPGASAEAMGMSPESSQRARGIEVWATLATLGRDGVADLVERCCRLARRFADGMRAAGFEVLNDVVLNQVLVSFGDAARTDAVIAAVQDDGTCWCGPTTWQDRRAMRVSVSGWSTTDHDIDRSVAAVRACAARTG
jgi:glutamate/tyrosine decarboxylase-like PLP-dependent enzyme